MDRNIDYSSLSNGPVVNLPERNVTSSVVTPPPPPPPPPATTSQQGSSATWNSPPLGTNIDMFDFTTATSGPLISSFASANTNNLVDMPFPQLASPYSSSNRSRGKKESHDTKRIKVESPTSALDSIDSWLQFDDDADKFGSFEIDYSKHYRPANQNRPSTDLTPGLGSGLYVNPTAPFREEDFFDDSAFDHSLSEDEELFESIRLDGQLSKVETLPPPEPPSRRSLYSTPLSWDRPQPGIQTSDVSMSNEIPRCMNNNNNNNNNNVWDAMSTQGNNYTLTADERRRLLDIAMGPGRVMSYVSPSRSGLGYGSAMQSNPIPTQEFVGLGMDPKQQQPGIPDAEVNRQIKPADPASSSGTSQATRDLKHKQPKNEAPPKPVSSKRASTHSEPGTKEKHRSADRIAHNDVERKYRTNLKDKITELRNAVPALQQAADAGGQDGAQGTAKVSKGTVLTKATEYIHQLEKRNNDIMTEHRQLIRRLQAFETLLNNSMRSAEMIPNHSMALFDPRGFC